MPQLKCLNDIACLWLRREQSGSMLQPECSSAVTYQRRRGPRSSEKEQSTGEELSRMKARAGRGEAPDRSSERQQGSPMAATVKFSNPVNIENATAASPVH